jgi:hypothetical protein
MSVNFQQLEHLVRQNNGHLYDYGQDGIIVTNLSGKELLHLPVNENDGIDRVKQFFSEISLRQIDPKEVAAKPVTWIDIGVPVLEDSEQRAMCSNALREMLEHYSPVVRVHFDNDPIVWQDLLSPFIETLQNDVTEGVVHVQLHGTFSQMEDSVMDFLFNNCIQLYYVSEVTSFNQHADKICNLAEYGFRVPCVWYVDSENINLIPSLIDEAMQWNYDAGFSLPLATERVIGQTRDHPLNVEYLRFILDIYKKYQCYDDVLYPMNMALLESIGVTRDSMLRTWRWDYENSSFREYLRDSNIDKIHKILRHSFVWQRHIIKNKLETLLPKDCAID